MRTRHTLLMALTVALIAAACGGTEPEAEAATDNPTDNPTPPGEEVSPADAALAHAQCMREEGIEDFPDPQITEDGGIMRQGQLGLDRNDPTLLSAQEACASHLEGLDIMGGGNAPDEEQIAEMQEQVLAFAQCMREQGIDFPDPDVSGGAVRITPGAGVDPESPQFQEAMASCQEALGTGEGGVRFGRQGSGGSGGQP